MSKSDAARVSEVFQSIITDVYQVAESRHLPPGTALTVDIGLELQSLAIEKKRSGGWALFKPKKNRERTSTLTVKLATRVVVTTPSQ